MNRAVEKQLTERALALGNSGNGADSKNALHDSQRYCGKSSGERVQPKRCRESRLNHRGGVAYQRAASSASVSAFN